MSFNNETLLQRALRTTDSTITTLHTIAVPENAVVRTDVVVLAKSSLGLAASWTVQLCVKRIANGPAILVQGQSAVGDQLKDGGVNWSVTVGVIGNDAVIQAKGANGIIVDWQFSGAQVTFVPPA